MAQQPSYRQAINPVRSSGNRPPGSYNQHMRRHSDGHSQNDKKPQLVQVIEQLMEKQGIEYYEKNVTNQLIEFMHYYVTETVQEAKLYRDYAGKERIDVGDMRLAIAGKNYDSFTRPLPVSTVRQVAEERNKTKLPDIETIQSISNLANAGTAGPRAGPQNQPPNTLPTSQEAHTLMAPNFHVFSEEIKSQIDQKRNKLLHYAVLQLQKGQEQAADAQKKAGIKDDKLKDSTSKRGSKAKQKQENLKKKGPKAAVSFGGAADQQQLLQQSATKSEQEAIDESNSKAKVEAQAPVIGKRKADTQIQIEFDPASIQQQAKPQENQPANDEVAKPLFQNPGSPFDTGLQPEQSSPNENPFMDSPPGNNMEGQFGQENQFALQDNAGTIEHNNPFGDDLGADFDFQQPELEIEKKGSKSLMFSSDQPQPEIFDSLAKTQSEAPGTFKPSLSALLPSMDMPEPEQEDDVDDENPFSDENMDDDSKDKNETNW